jgi:NAD(P)H-dependent FMN reductase
MTTAAPKIGIIFGSTRPGRNGEQVAHWVLQHAQQRTDATYELIDLAEVGLPLLDEAMPLSMGQYADEHTRAWAKTIASFDGFVIVTPEYNHGIPAALKNALDYPYAEWNNKAVGFVGYGTHGAARAVEHLRGVAGELQMADVRAQVSFTLATDFEFYSVFKPGDHHLPVLTQLLDQLTAWSTALAPLRATTAAAA